MNEEKRKAIAAVLMKLSVYFDVVLPESRLKLFVDQLQDVDPMKLLIAGERFTSNPKNRFFPFPSQLRELLGSGFMSDEAKAEDAASRITGAITRYGYTWINLANQYEPGGWTACSKKVLGELGVLIVHRLGGWSQLCQSDSPVGVAHAQFKRVGLSILESTRAGIRPEDPPPLPAPTGRTVGRKFEGLMKSLTGGES